VDGALRRSSENMNTVYLHGIPGSPAELQLGAVAAAVPAACLYAPARCAASPGASMSAYTDGLEADIRRRFPHGPLRLVGFSLGTKLALELAARLGSRVHHVHLVSPAAPLEAGNFLPHMAGRPVFAIARASPALLALLVWLQALTARLAPALLARQLFASAAGEDATLARNSAFKAMLRSVFAASFTGSCWGYRREVLAYVRPWGATVLPLVKAPVTIWQGSADNWTPPAMAAYLAAALPTARAVPVLHTLAGRSHYSTLAAALPLILEGGGGDGSYGPLAGGHPPP
jgi:pimeloyl-ACP methyl ester carboxylesterase